MGCSGSTATSSVAPATVGEKRKAPERKIEECTKHVNADGTHERIPRGDLETVGLLGNGGFASVELVKHKTSGKTFAMKCMSKGFICQAGMKDQARRERDVMLMTDSNFVIRLFETYSGPQMLHMLMEVALGGELHATYKRLNLYGRHHHARYYVAGVVLALDHLHELDIIYRDLKPENLLLDSMGHLKIADFGLAKCVVGKTYTTCGIPDYMAPETVASEGQTKAVDWWALGVLLFELLTGSPPFEAQTPMLVYAKITKGIGKVKFPKASRGPAEDLVRSLLKREPGERLPMLPDGAEGLRKHAFHSGFDWCGLESGTLEAPYVPAVKSAADLSNFSARRDDAPRPVEYHDDGTGWDKDFATADE